MRKYLCSNERDKRNSAKRTIAVILACLTFWGIFSASLIPASAAAEVTIAQASRGEKGKYTGNKPGNQNGQELNTARWTYSPLSISSFNWSYVLRARDHELAREIAANMMLAVNNKHIGYDRQIPDRMSLYDEAKKVNWDISKVRKNCETSCTSVLSVCLNASGIKAPRLWYAGQVKRFLLETGQFECFETSEYVASNENLWVGDILVNPRKHVAVVAESSNPFTYEVTYTNTEGKKSTVEIEEDSKIVLNPNNGSDTEMISITDDTDITNIKPEKNGYEFTGWEKTGSRFFSARYETSQASIFVKREKIVIKG